MDEFNNESVSVEEIIKEFTPTEEIIDQRPAPDAAPKPRTPRRRRSKRQIFKEQTLPLIILAVAGALIVTFIAGSIVRASQKRKIETEAAIAASEAAAAEEARLNEEMNQILEDAKLMAAGYDYDGAIQRINGFSGNIGAYPKLQDAKVEYEYQKSSVIPWTDHNAIINLSFQTLVVDPERAYADADYGNSLRNNFVTVSEFEKILEQLYANGYVLVTPKDFVDDSDAAAYAYKELLLPEGKKPLVLTQTNVNYNLYLVDSDGDLMADQGGCGIGSKLVMENGAVTCEYMDAEGNVSTGAYDLIPILDAFIKEHPDFSYHGSKAVLAVTGYNGLFGYRTHEEGRVRFGEETYEENVKAVKEIAETLKNNGYSLACYTYANKPYGIFSLSEIQADMGKWNDEVVPILGSLDTFVFAQNSDINSGILYSGEKYDYLKSLGYNTFMGFCTDGDSFTFISEEYVRQGRVMVTGENMIYNDKWFTGIFDPAAVLDEARN